MRIATTTAALLAALALAACSSSSNGNPTSAPSGPSSPPASTSPASSASSPTVASSSAQSSSSSSSSSSSGGLTEARAKSALLTATELGSGFTQTPSQNTDTPLPCAPNDPPLNQQFPPNVKVQSDFTGLSGKAAFSEEIETFDDAAAVGRVISAGEHGLACGKATVSGTSVNIAGPTVLTSQLATPVDKAEAWTVSSSSLNASLIIVQLGQHLVVFSFAAAPSVQPTALPDGRKIVNTALAKVAAAI